MTMTILAIVAFLWLFYLSHSLSPFFRFTCVLVELLELNHPIHIHIQVHECEAMNID